MCVIRARHANASFVIVVAIDCTATDDVLNTPCGASCFVVWAAGWALVATVSLPALDGLRQTQFHLASTLRTAS